MHRILYRLVAALACLMVRSGRAKDLEIIVLRHQLEVLHRSANRPVLADDDRTLLAAIAQALPRPRRHGWLVTPDTLLRWHRRRVARHWTHPPQRRPGRPTTAIDPSGTDRETSCDPPVFHLSIGGRGDASTVLNVATSPQTIDFESRPPVRLGSSS